MCGGGKATPLPPPTTTSRVTHDCRCRPVRKIYRFLEVGFWSTWRWIIAPVDDCDGQLLPPGLMVSPWSWESKLSALSCLPLVRRADHRPCPVSLSISDVCWSCLSLVVPVGADTGAKPPATLVGVGLQRRLPCSVMNFESRRDSTLPYPSPVLGMATAVWNLPAPAPDGLVTWCTREVASGVYEITAKLCQLLSACDVAQEARLIGIDRWMILRSYCVWSRQRN